MTWTSSSAGTSRLILFENSMNSAEVWFGRRSWITLPEAMSRAANRSMVPLRGSRVSVAGWWWASSTASVRCGAVQCLDPGFLVDGEHGCVDGRVHVEPDDVTDLGHELGVDLEVVDLPQLQLERPPDLRHRLMEDPVAAPSNASTKVSRLSVSSRGCRSRSAHRIVCATSTPWRGCSRPWRRSRHRSTSRLHRAG